MFCFQMRFRCQVREYEQALYAPFIWKNSHDTNIATSRYSCDGDLAVYIRALENSLPRIPPNSLSKVLIIYI